MGESTFLKLARGSCEEKNESVTEEERELKKISV
jgi:hypothetical protein